ncbi:MAG: AI-2E family transporter [Bacteroidota bacterium]
MDIKGNGLIQDSPVIKLAGLIIIIAGVIYAKSIIAPFILAFFISIICAQPINWLEKKKTPRWLALMIVILVLILLFFGFSIFIGETLASFSSNVSKYESALKAIIISFIQYLNENGVNIPQSQVSSLVQPEKILEFTASALNGLFKMVGNTFLIFLIIFFILTELKSFPIKAKAIMNVSGKSITYFSTIIENIRHYLWIKTLFCLLIGILIYVALLIIGVSYPLLWALIAFLMSYIPNIGSIIAAVPAVLFSLVQLGLGSALWTLVSFLLINNVIGNFVEPRIMGKGLGLSTLVVFLSLLIWGFILGPVGMFLSVPITMAIKIIMEHNENTRWIAILLGTSVEAKTYLKHKDLNQKKPI